jgi:autonomous glycyl radical cofactor GrcA
MAATGPTRHWDGEGRGAAAPRGAAEGEQVRAYPPGPSRARGLAVIAAVGVGLCLLASRVETGQDEMVGKLGRIEVTARLVERPEQFPQLGAYRYTYVLKYNVLKVHRQDPAKKYPLKPGDDIFVGHYKPWLPRSRIKDADWGESPLGGKLDQLNVGEAHRLALDYELADLAPSGALDYCFPPGTNRFFALWANPTTY